MKIAGRAWRFGDDVNTDLILPGRYLELTDPKEMARHAMEGVLPSFSERVKPGDILVAGRNLGCGSSREHAPLALKHAGIGAVVAESFARIFYRNSINIGLPALQCPAATSEIMEGDLLEIDPERGSLKNLSRNRELHFTPLPRFILEIISEGGLTEYLKRHGGKWPDEEV